MSDVKASAPSSPMMLATAAPSAALPGSERPDYRGKCLYKTGKCVNERALKTSGAAHNLCDEHRNRQNQHQRKLDAKNRLHKRERRTSTSSTADAAGDAKAAKSERFAPYPTASAKRQSPPTPLDTSDDADADELPVTAAPATLPAAAALASAPAGIATAAAAATTVVEVEETPSSSLVTQAQAVGGMFLPNGPQPPQLSYPFVMQDFDGIVVPLPSYLEGQERIEFRSRIYQKVLDFISEECILRFGARVEPASADGGAVPGGTEMMPTIPQTSTSGLEAGHQTSSEGHTPSLSGERPSSDIPPGPQRSSNSVTEESRTTAGSTTKKVH